MPAKSASTASHPDTPESHPSVDSMPMQAPDKRNWETPELKIVPTDETESGFIFATREETTIPTRPLAS